MMHHCVSSISCKCWCYVLYMGHVLVYTCTTCADLLLITQIRHAGMEFWFKATIITFVVEYLNTRSRRVVGSHENVGEIVVVVHENDARLHDSQSCGWPGHDHNWTWTNVIVSAHVELQCHKIMLLALDTMFSYKGDEDYQHSWLCVRWSNNCASSYWSFPEVVGDSGELEQNKTPTTKLKLGSTPLFLRPD